MLEEEKTKLIADVIQLSLQAGRAADSLLTGLSSRKKKEMEGGHDALLCGVHSARCNLATTLLDVIKLEEQLRKSGSGLSKHQGTVEGNDAHFLKLMEELRSI